MKNFVVVYHMIFMICFVLFRLIKFHVKNVVLFFLVETITEQLSMGRKDNGNETTNKTDEQRGTVHLAYIANLQ